MSRSYLILILALVAGGFSACSTVEPPKPATPPFVARSTTLEVTNGVKILTTVGMPNGFAPIAGRPPMWLQNGAEIGVIGTDGGHTIVYGLGGPGWPTGRGVAPATAPPASEAG